MSGVPRPSPGRGPVVRVRLAQPPRHGEPGTDQPPQGRVGAGPGDRGRGSWSRPRQLAAASDRGARLPRRARPRRLGAIRAGGAAGARRLRGRRARRRPVQPGRGAAACDPTPSGSRASLSWSRCCGARIDGPSRPHRTAATLRPPRQGPVRGAGARGGARGARGRCGRWPSPAPDRSARRRARRCSPSDWSGSCPTWTTAVRSTSHGSTRWPHSCGPSTGCPRVPPFRSPHHTASLVAMVGGGSGMLRPGEISLASGGVLFLDELGEFPVSPPRGAPPAARVGRDPRCPGRCTTSRCPPASCSSRRPTPARAVSGSWGDCSCSPAQVARYRRRLSGPLLDRFDLRLEVDPPDPAEVFSAGVAGETTTEVRRRVAAARARGRGTRCQRQPAARRGRARRARAADAGWARPAPGARSLPVGCRCVAPNVSGRSR